MRRKKVTKSEISYTLTASTKDSSALPTLICNFFPCIKQKRRSESKQRQNMTVIKVIDTNVPKSDVASGIS